MAFWDDLSEFGSGLLDDVGEGFGNLIQSATTDDKTKNPGVTQQPQQPVKDNYGNAVTAGTPQPHPQATDKTMLYVGGGVGALLLLTLLVVATKK